MKKVAGGKFFQQEKFSIFSCFFEVFLDFRVIEGVIEVVACACLAQIGKNFGIDTETLYANLYLDEFSQLKFKAHVYEAMKMTENGDHGIPVPTYVEENVSTKVVKIIQSYTGVVNKMVWRKF